MMMVRGAAITREDTDVYLVLAGSMKQVSEQQ